MKELTEVRREIEAINDSMGLPIDQKIKDLVIGLRRWGIETVMSCEGHENGLKYPWIDVDIGSVEKLVEILGVWWKKESDCDQPRWLIKSHAGGMVRIIPEDKRTRSLQEMQEDAKNFGRFLQEIPEGFFKKEETA